MLKHRSFMSAEGCTALG